MFNCFRKPKPEKVPEINSIWDRTNCNPYDSNITIKFISYKYSPSGKCWVEYLYLDKDNTTWTEKFSIIQEAYTKRP